jgi:hypothetical protein
MKTSPHRKTPSIAARPSPRAAKSGSNASSAGRPPGAGAPAPARPEAASKGRADARKRPETRQHAGSIRDAAAAPSEGPSAPTWTFLTNHGHVLLSIASDPTARLRDLAGRVGITERAVQRIVAELEEAGYLTHEREGRRNVYRIRAQLPLRHPVERHQKVAALLSLVEGRTD